MQRESSQLVSLGRCLTDQVAGCHILEEVAQERLISAHAESQIHKLDHGNRILRQVELSNIDLRVPIFRRYRL